MRHDSHYVEELASQSPTTIGRLIGIDQLDPNPLQPRVEIGDLAELISSVKEHGVLEPLLVKPSSIKGRGMIIAGGDGRSAGRVLSRKGDGLLWPSPRNPLFNKGVLDVYGGGEGWGSPDGRG